MATIVAETERRESPHPGPLTWGEFLRDLVAANGLETNVATWLIEEAMGVRSAERLCRLGEPVPPSALRRVEGWCERLLAGEPLAYVLGHWSFWDVELAVGPGVLVPRPETEVLVEVALDVAAQARLDGGRGSDDPDNVVVDLGTGSGAIAVVLARELRRIVLATERSAVAAGWARRNVVRLAATVEVREGDWWEALPSACVGRVGLAVANPPYVSAAEMVTLPRTVAAYEPTEALCGGASGLEATEAILLGATVWLAPRGVLVVEVAEERAELTAARAEAVGLTPLGLHRDLAGRPRVLVVERPAPRSSASGAAAWSRQPRVSADREVAPVGTGSLVTEPTGEPVSEPVDGCDQIPLDRPLRPGRALFRGAGRRGAGDRVLGEEGAGSEAPPDPQARGARSESRLGEGR